MAKAIHPLRLALEGLTRPAEVLRVTGTDTGVHVREITKRLQTRLNTAVDGVPADVKTAAQRDGACLLRSPLVSCAGWMASKRAEAEQRICSDKPLP